MKKRVLGLIIGVCMLTGSSCFAMQFSPVEEMGGMSYSQGGRHSTGGLILKNPTHNTGDYYTTNAYNADNTYSYGKGVAAFGQGIDAMYVYYNMYAHTVYVGGNSKTILLSPAVARIANSWRFMITDISRVRTDGDTLIINYGNWRSREYGEFRFRWDENAQWFGIEQIVY